MREIIMSQGQDLHISSIFIKGETIFLPFVISTMRVGLDVWMKVKKKYYSHYFQIQVLMIYRLYLKINVMEICL